MYKVFKGSATFQLIKTFIVRDHLAFSFLESVSFHLLSISQENPHSKPNHFYIRIILKQKYNRTLHRAPSTAPAPSPSPPPATSSKHDQSPHGVKRTRRSPNLTKKPNMLFPPLKCPPPCTPSLVSTSGMVFWGSAIEVVANNASISDWLV